MALRDVTHTGVDAALREFHRLGLNAMLREYGGEPSFEWYVQVGNWRYSQELVLRAAHVHQGLGMLPPQGDGAFTPAQARHHLEDRLGYRVEPTLQANFPNLATAMATEPLMRWLIGAAHHRTTITYRDAGDRLERECGFGPIFSVLMGRPPGAMQHALLHEDPAAPLLHVLLVRKGSGVPGPGAREFLQERFPDVPQLQQAGVDQTHRDLWAVVVGSAAEEVYRYPSWERIYEQMYGEFVPDPFFAPPVEGGGAPPGGAGEGPNHRALRLWVQENPARIGSRYHDAVAVTEEELLSGDRVDVVYYTDREVVAIEVKSQGQFFLAGS